MLNITFFNKNISNQKISIKSNSELEQNEEYKQNQMQIDCIKKVLIEHADVPEKLLNWLIDSVQKNVELKYEKMS